jgi:hypothetical protein
VSQKGIATSNPLADFPQLTGFNDRPGFASADPDGVYRAYLANGTIIDAARLTSEQVQTWVNARAPYLSAEEAMKERELYTGVNGQDVAEAQLLAPAEALQPKKQLEAFARDSTSALDVGPLVDRRRASCPTIVCLRSPNLCKACTCNGILCR